MEKCLQKNQLKILPILHQNKYYLYKIQVKERLSQSLINLNNENHIIFYNNLFF